MNVYLAVMEGFYTCMLRSCFEQLTPLWLFKAFVGNDAIDPQPPLSLSLFPADGSGMEGASTATPATSLLPASGNGVIAQPKKVRGVGFGDIFREGSVKLKVRLPSPEMEEKKERVSGTRGMACTTWRRLLRRH